MRPKADVIRPMLSTDMSMERVYIVYIWPIRAFIQVNTLQSQSMVAVQRADIADERRRPFLTDDDDSLVETQSQNSL